MNLICRFIFIAYVTVRSYDTSYSKVTFFFLLFLTSLNCSEMYLASGIVSFIEKVLTQFRVSKVMQFLLLLNTYNTITFISRYNHYLTMLYDTYDNDAKLDYESYL